MLLINIITTKNRDISKQNITESVFNIFTSSIKEKTFGQIFFKEKTYLPFLKNNLQKKKEV